MAGPAAAQEKFKAVTTFTVIADMAQNVAGDAAIVESITKPDAEIHNYQPTPGDIIAAQDADLILWNGLNLELVREVLPQSERRAERRGLRGRRADGHRRGTLYRQAQPACLDVAEAALIYVENIRKAFVEHDPENAETYRAMPPPIPSKIKATVEPIRRRWRPFPRSGAGW